MSSATASSAPASRRRDRRHRLRRSRQRPLSARPRAARRCSASSRSTPRAAAIGRGTRCARRRRRACKPICLQRPWPSQTPTLLAWLSRNAPDIYARAGNGPVLCKDFVTFRLTGARGQRHLRHVSGAGLLRLPDCTYDDDLLAALRPRRRPRPAAASSLRPDRDRRRRHAPRPRRDRPCRRARRSSAGYSMSSRAPSARASCAGRGLDHRRDMEHQPGVLRRSRSSTPACSWSSGFGAGPLHGDRIERHLRRQPRMVCARTGRARAATMTILRRLQRPRRRRRRPRPDDPFFHPVPLRLAARGARCAPASTALPAGTARGISLRALFEGVAFEHRRHVEVLQERRHAVRPGRSCRAAARAARSGRRCSPTSSASRSPSPHARRPARSAPPSPRASASAYLPIYDDGVSDCDPRAMSPRTQSGHGTHYGERYEAFLMLAEAMKPLWARLDAAGNA